MWLEFRRVLFRSDASGHGAHLTAHGSPSCVTGRFGNAWLLDGSTQYLDRASDPLFTPGTRAWSVAAWEKSSGVPNYRFLVSWYRCGANPVCTTPDLAVYGLGLHEGHPYIEARDDAGSDLSIEDIQLNLADGAWHFIVETFNPSTDTLKLFIDGALHSTLAGSIGTLTKIGRASCRERV